MTILAIEHVQLAMPAGQEQRARQFYVHGLGLEEVAKPANLAKRGGCWFERGGVRVHLGVDASFHPATKAHPAFIVADLAALAQHLDRLGYSVKADEPLQGFQRTYVSDPFGNRIELMEPVA